MNKTNDYQIMEKTMKKAVEFVFNNANIRGILLDKEDFYKTLDRTYERLLHPEDG